MKVRRKAGIALVMALGGVVMLSTLLSETFFSSEMELKMLQTYKEKAQARNLSLLAFRAFQRLFMLKETDMQEAYLKLKDILATTEIPWEEGSLVAVEILPLDSLYNLNELHNLPNNSSLDELRWNVFRNLTEDFKLSPHLPEDHIKPTEQSMASLYGATVDFIDSNSITYSGSSGGSGSEYGVYASREPRVEIKNAKLDRLYEFRLVEGVRESGISWSFWENNFSALPKKNQTEAYPEKLNINTATEEELVDFLKKRDYPDIESLDSTLKDVQRVVNQYAEKAEDIAQLLISQDSSNRRVYSRERLEQELGLVLDSNAAANSEYLLGLFNEYYKLVLETKVNEVSSKVEALLYVKRNNDFQGVSMEVLEFWME